MFQRSRTGANPNGVARRTNYILLLLALLFSLLTTLIVWRQLTERTTASAKAQTQAVLVVVKPLGPHQVISSEDVAIRDVPKSAVQAGAVTALSQAVGQYTAARWFPGQQVIAPMLVASSTPAGFALNIPSGERAYTLPDDAIVGVDHLLSPGDHVDILVTFSSSSNHGPISQTLLQNIQVLYVDNAPTAGASSNSTGSSSSSKSSGQSDTITVAVTPQQANVLDYGATFGQLHFTLRPPDDSASTSAAAVTSATFGAQVSPSTTAGK